MGISFDKALGVHPTALMLHERRTTLLTENIANSDTPNYKSKDFDFADMMKKVQAGEVEHLRTTQANHINPDGLIPAHEMKYRIPMQASLDGNTVDPHIEKGEFAKNALQMQSSLRFLNGRFSSLEMVLKGN